MTSASPRVPDRSAWRQAFAEPDEKLVLVLAEGAASVDQVLDLIPEDPSFRVLLQGGRSHRRGVQELEAWSSSLIPALLSIAETTIILPGREAALPESLDYLGQGHRIFLPRGSGPKAPPSGVEILEFDNIQGGMSAAFDRSRIAPAKSLILYNEWGIGDELLLSAVAREVLRAHPSFGVWIRSRHAFRFPDFVRRDEPPADARQVETIYQNPTMYGPDHHAPFPGHLVQQMLDKIYVDTGLLVKAEDVRPCLAGPRFEIRKVPRRQVLLHSKGNPRLPSKEWGLERWAALCGLLRSAGVEVVQVGAAEEPLLPQVIDRRGTPVADLESLLAETGLVVCLVGFLMHLAAAVGTPAVVIYGGREHPAIDGYPDQVHLASGALPCRGRWGCHLAPDLACPNGMRCMEGLTPEFVAGEVLDALGVAT